MLQTLIHNWALVSILGTIFVVLLVTALILAKYINISLRILYDAPLPLSRKVRDFRPLSGETVEFWASDGLQLRGTIIHRPRTSQPPRGLIVFAPEFKSDRESCARYCRALWEAGYDLFTFDFRNHGESAEEPNYIPRQWASDREVKDMQGACAFVEEWLRSQNRPVEYGLFGISRGAGAGILVAAHNPAIKAICSDSAFSADRVLEHYMQRYAEVFASIEVIYRNHPPEFWSFLRWCVFIAARRRFGCVFPSVQRAITRMAPRPMLFVHGGRDSYIDEIQSRKLYAVAAQPRYLWIVPKAKHNQSVIVEPQEYARRTVDFFDFYLARQAATDNLYQSGRWEKLIQDKSGVWAGGLEIESETVLASPTADELRPHGVDTEAAHGDTAESTSEPVDAGSHTHSAEAASKSQTQSAISGTTQEKQ